METGVFDTDKRLDSRPEGMSRRELLEMMKKLCRTVTAQAADDGFRGGVRPDNISLGEDGSVALGPGGRSERSGWSAAELEFMAPEEFWNDRVSSASDVYALGLVMYWCLAGRVPFDETGSEDAADRAAVLRRRMNGEVIEAPKGAGRLAPVIEKSLRFQAGERYKNAHELESAIDECICMLDTVPAPASEVAFQKPEGELSELERMMLGIIGSKAEDAAITAEQNPPAEPKIEIPQETPVSEPAPEVAPVEEPQPAPQPQKTPEPEKAPEPIKEPEPMPVYEPKPPRIAEDTDKARRANARPVVQYGMGEDEYIPPKEKRSKAPIIVLIILCAAVVVAALVLRSLSEPDPTAPTPPAVSSDVSDNPLLIPSQSPAVSESPELSPSPSPSVSIAPTAESTYEIFVEDISWMDAQQKCEQLGGHLVVINSQEELDTVTSLAVGAGVRFVWLGCYRSIPGELEWVNGEDVTFYKWAPGEPSRTESDGTPENYVLLWNTRADLSGTWEYNDVGNDPVSIYPAGYSGRIAYICETEG